MNKRISNDRDRLASVGLVLRKVGVFTVGLAIALLGVLRELFVSVKIQHDEEHHLHGSNLIGEYNHRTGQLDAGTDPNGWYEEDM